MEEKNNMPSGHNTLGSISVVKNQIENIGKYPSYIAYLLEKESFFDGVINDLLNSNNSLENNFKKYRDNFFSFENGLDNFNDREIQDSFFGTLLNVIKDNCSYLEITRIINFLSLNNSPNTLNYYLLDDIENDPFFEKFIYFIYDGPESSLRYFKQKEGKNYSEYKYSNSIEIHHKDNEFTLIYNSILGNESDNELADLFGYLDSDDTFYENNRYIVKVKDEKLLNKIILQREELLKNGDKYLDKINSPISEKYKKEEYKKNPKKRFSNIEQKNNDDYIYPLDERISEDVEKYFEGIEEDPNFHLGLELDTNFYENVKKAYFSDLNYFYSEIDNLKNGGNLEFRYENYKNFFTLEKYLRINGESYDEKFFKFLKFKLSTEEENDIYLLLKKKDNKNKTEEKIFKLLEKSNEQNDYLITEDNIKKLEEKTDKSRFEEKILDYFKNNNLEENNINNILKKTNFNYISDNILTGISNNFGNKLKLSLNLDNIKKSVKKSQKKGLDKINKKYKTNYFNITKENLDKYDLNIVFNDLFKNYEEAYLNKDYLNKNYYKTFKLDRDYLEKNYPDKRILNFLTDVKEGLNIMKNDKDFINIHILSILEEGRVTLYEKEIDNENVYIGGLNSIKGLGAGFDFFEEIVEIRGKEKNIEIYVIDEIGGKNHDNEWLLEKYQELGFELQKDNNGDNIKVSWGENDRNTNLVMVRPKG